MGTKSLIFNLFLFFSPFLITTIGRSQTLANEYKRSTSISETIESLLFDQKNAQYFIGTRKILFLDEGYIPQGLHLGENEYYVSMYHKSQKGETGTKASIIVRYDVEGNFLQKINLKKDQKEFTGHVGGLGLIGENFVIPEGRELYFFSIMTGEFIKKTTPDFLNFGEQIKTISYLNISKDHLGNKVLLLGEFRERNEGYHDNTILAYPIKDNQDIGIKPQFYFKFPNTLTQIQGCAIIEANEKNYSLLISRSYGDYPSKLHKLSFINETKEGYSFKLLTSKEVLSAPAGMEGVAVSDTRVWSLSESGANYFQKRTNSPWKTNFPFVFTLNKKLILKSN